MLYPAHTRAGRGNLVLRHSVPHFEYPTPNFGGVEWRNLTPLDASTPERRNRSINLSKYFISSSGNRTHNRRVTVTRSLQVPSVKNIFFIALTDRTPFPSHFFNVLGCFLSVHPVG